MFKLKRDLVPLSVIICLLATLCFVFAQETLTITTYYPSPYGSYQDLETGNLTFRESADGLVHFNYNDTTYDRRLRITAGFNDSGNNDQGASIDLHGINATSYLGRLDLVAGRGSNVTFWSSPVGTSALERMRITNAGNVGIGPCSYADARVSICGTNGSDDAVLVAAKEDGAGNNPAFSILPWDSAVYLYAGVYFSNGTLVHHSDSTSSVVFGLDPTQGAIWAASNNSSASWNLTGSPPPGAFILWNTTGVWTGPSSRSLKENFTPLNLDELLEKIDQLDLSRWNFKSEGKSITHIGPVAEDFYQLFRIGYGEKNLASIDSIGVSLSGVKALSRKLKSQQQQIEQLQREIKELKLQFSRRQ